MYVKSFSNSILLMAEHVSYLTVSVEWKVRLVFRIFEINTCLVFVIKFKLDVSWCHKR
jgi:hypothetical protein